MLIVCPNCATAYQVDTAAIGGSGRTVRCTRCKTAWVAELLPGERATRLRPLSADASTEPNTRSAAAAGIDGQPPPSSEVARTAEAALANADAPLLAPANGAVGVDPAHALEPPPGPDAGHALALSEIPIPVEQSSPLAPMYDDTMTLRNEPDMAADRRRAAEAAAVRHARRAALRSRNRNANAALPFAIVVLIGAVTAVLAWRDEVVRVAPQTASFYRTVGLPVNVRGIEFTDVVTAKTEQDGVPVLVVEGVLINRTAAIVEVPRLRFAVRDAAGAEIYSWTAQPPSPLLPPREKLEFRGRLASPPGESHEVLVRFFNRRDAVVAVR